MWKPKRIVCFLSIISLFIVLAFWGGCNTSGGSITTFMVAKVVIGQANFTANSANRGGDPANNTLNRPEGSAAGGSLYIPDTLNHRVLVYNTIPTTNGAAADLVLGQTDFTSNAPGSTFDKFDYPEKAWVEGGKLFLATWNNGRVLIWNTLPTTNGEAADVEVGNSGGCDANALSGANALAVGDNKLLGLSESDYRVSVWNAIPTTSNTDADLVIGQSDWTHCSSNDTDQDGSSDEQPSANVFLEVKDVWTDGTRVVIVDAGNHRVLIWNTFPTSNFAPADLVLGQSDFTHNAPNDDNQDGSADGTPSARTMDYPYGVVSDGTRLFVSDTYNHRVLIWNTFPTSNFQPADLVLGQSDFTHNAPNDDDQDGSEDATSSARTFDDPRGLLFYEGNLIISDRGNNRVLVF